MATNSPTTERPPIIAVLGHIDHGKSTLLDHIRKSNTTAGEAGGITQHLSAYEVRHEREGKEKRITFLDTPGHEAFGAMRARGTKVADIAILVVAADDGVKAQTIEALGAITNAGIPYIVAINKIDKPEADLNRAIQSLIEHGIYIEGYGGDVPYVALSAATGENVDELLDIILLVAELAELTADPSTPGEGVVIETNVDPKRGTSATLIIKNGTLRQGMYVAAGTSTTPVRLMEDFTGTRIQEASFSSPVRLTGFNEAPEIGEHWQSFDKRKDAEAAALTSSTTAAESTPAPHAVNEEIFTIPLVIKTNVSGTREAVEHEITKLATERAEFRVVHTGLGNITDNDVRLAGSKPGTIIVGFNVSVTQDVKELADRQNVSIATFDIIYELGDWLRDRLTERTPRRETKVAVGQAKILKTFSRQRIKQIIGGRLESGKITKNSALTIERRGEEIGQAKIQGLQVQKMPATEVSEGNEFGAEIESRLEIAPGDRLIAYEIHEE
jgi:translation initiation factor IF-2